MFKRIFLLAVFILPLTLFAQDYLWSHRGGCFNEMGTFSKRNQVLEITSDSEGNIYMLAQSGSSEIQLAEIPLTGYADVNGVTNNNQFNLVFASFTPEGENRWVKVIGGYLNTYGYTLKTDDLGHVYLSGRIYPVQPQPNKPPVHFDTDTILPQAWEMNQHKRIMYMAQYDTDGNFNWLHMPEPDTVSQVSFWANNSWPYRADVDPENGDVYWHCLLREGQFDWEGDNVITEESDYILQYNSAGEVTGRVKLDMSSAGANTVSNECLMFMERDHETGIFYIAGTQVNDFYPLIIGGQLITDRLFAAAFSPTGALLWSVEGSDDGSMNLSYGNNHIYDMKIDDGHIYLTGTLARGSEFNGHYFDLDGATGCSPFIMKIDFDGNTQWAHISATEFNSFSRALAIRGDEVAIAGKTGPLSWPEANGTEAITGYTYNGHISRFDKNSGNLIALDSISPVSGLIDINAIYAPQDCNYYIGGVYDNSVILGQDTLLHQAVSEQTYFISRYSFGSELAFTYSPSGTPGSFDFYAVSDDEAITWDFGDGSPSQTGISVDHTFSEEGEYEVCATSSSYCESEFCVTIQFGTTGLGELTDDFKIYPNPASSEIRVDGLDQTSKYSLFSSNGGLVQQGSVNPNGSIDISGLSGGMYVLMFQVEDGGFARMKIAVK